MFEKLFNLKGEDFSMGNEMIALLGFGSMGLFGLGFLAYLVQIFRKKSKTLPTIIMAVAAVVFVYAVLK